MAQTPKLSEAIREGAKLRPQGFGHYFTGLSRGDGDIRSCAIGAAVEARRGVIRDVESRTLLTDFPILKRDVDACPVGDCEAGGFSTNLFGVASHLNDDHRWTREQIADYVETIEFADTPKE